MDLVEDYGEHQDERTIGGKIYGQASYQNTNGKQTYE